MSKFAERLAKLEACLGVRTVARRAAGLRELVGLWRRRSGRSRECSLDRTGDEEVIETCRRQLAVR
jgi:hypothetical protein